LLELLQEPSRERSPTQRDDVNLHQNLVVSPALPARLEPWHRYGIVERHEVQFIGCGAEFAERRGYLAEEIVRLVELLIKPSGAVVAESGRERGLVVIELDVGLLEDVPGKT
jgi:hypothetical protein